MHPVSVYPPGTQQERELDATVVLLNADTNQPNCSAVSILDSHMFVVLVTAAHCVQSKVDIFDPSPSAAKWANVGDSIYYITKENWSDPSSIVFESKIQSIDEPRDRVVLSVFQNEAPVPLKGITGCDRCLYENYPVHTISSIFGWVNHKGVVTGKTYSGAGSSFFESSITIDFGFSGSPVINESGEVMGIITRCDPLEIKVDYGTVYKKCKKGWSLFTSLP